jgi:uncharacterized pyridoxamine 5'-phosphate oxidase family protein
MEPRELADRILASTDVAFLATCDGDQPRVRPLNIALYEGLNLWIASYTEWGKVGQLQRNPKVEVNVMLDSGAHIRMVGRGHIRDAEADRRRVFEGFPLMQRYFADWNDPAYTLIEIVPEEVGVKEGWELEYRVVPLDATSSPSR